MNDTPAATPPEEPVPAEVEAPDPDTADPADDPDNNLDDAPDANEPGDQELPAELAEHVHEGDVPADHVDAEG